MSNEPLFIHVYDGLTGEEFQREMTPEEVAEYEARTVDAPVLPDAE